MRSHLDVYISYNLSKYRELIQLSVNSDYMIVFEFIY
jgi:hypothetical protein